MLKLVGIHKIYEDSNIGFLALKDINLDFTDDKFVCILGKSGSGKTTLLNIIGGLDKASAGHMVIDGVLTTKFTENQWDYFRNYKIGFIFQNFSLIEHLSVLDNVMLSIKLQGVSIEEAKDRSLKMLDKVHILDQAYKLPKQLSGGQRQRVAIARALVNDPDIILADEPTGNLDKKTTREVLEVIKEISGNKLIIMVTHSKKIANEYADRIIDLKDGVVLSDTKPYQNERVKIVKHKTQMTKFKLVDKIKHAFKNLKMKKWRSFLTSLGLAIGVAGFIIINGISNGIKVNMKEQMESYNNRPDMNFLVRNEYFVNNNISYEGYVDHLIEDDDIKAVRYNKRINLSPVSINGHDLQNVYSYYSPYGQLSYQFNDFGDENRKYYGSLYENGSWPENDDEIVLSYQFASSLYDVDNIKTLWERLENATLEIATDFYYIPPYYLLGYVDEFVGYPYVDENTVPEGYDESIFGSFASQIAKQKELYNEVLIYQGKIYVTADYSKFQQEKSLNVKSVKQYTVVGINETQNNSYSYVTKDEYMDFNTSDYESKYNQEYQIFLTEKAKDNLFDFKLKYHSEADIYETPDYSNVEVPVFNLFIDMAQFIISMILFVSVITAGIMLLMVLLISVIERSREIGILRSLGATRSDILSVFVVESGLIGFFAGVIGNIMAYSVALGGNLFINTYFKEDIETMFNRDQISLILVKPLYGIIAIIVCIFFAMIFGLIPAISASKKTPIEALKRL